MIKSGNFGIKATEYLEQMKRDDYKTESERLIKVFGGPKKLYKFMVDILKRLVNGGDKEVQKYVLDLSDGEVDKSDSEEDTQKRRVKLRREQRDSTSLPKGVYETTSGTYLVKIFYQGSNNHIGVFETLELATLANETTARDMLKKDKGLQVSAEDRERNFKLAKEAALAVAVPNQRGGRREKNTAPATKKKSAGKQPSKNEQDNQSDSEEDNQKRSEQDNQKRKCEYEAALESVRKKRAAKKEAEAKSKEGGGE